MCAGVTLFDPLRRYGAKEGTRVGIVGLGGLGQMGISVAKALGCHVTAVSRGETKRDLATQLGAASFIDSRNAESMSAAHGTLDLVLNTIPFDHDYNAYTRLLTPGKGTHVVLGLNNTIAAALLVDGLTCGRSRVKMSGIGGIEATQAVIDLCAKHNITPLVKIIDASEINRVYEELERGNESGVRHVIDIETLRSPDLEAKCAAAAPPAFGSNDGGISFGGLLSTAADMFFTLKWW